MAADSTKELPMGFDLHGRPETVEVARQAIDRIRSDRGDVSEYDLEQLSRTDPAWRQEYLRKAANLRDVYARFTSSIAEQLYSSDFRLIYELLQNADDAHYDDDVEASVKFSVSSNELIIDINECGFTLPNVIALCDTGKSSKVNDATTTGEKGFGFKSVFKIADVVHVRSGFWSFRFENDTDDGLGMVTPLWTDTLQSASKHDGTRIRLEYCDSDEFSLKEMISQFEQLPKSILFSTRQVSRLDVKFEDVLGRNDSISFCFTSDLENDQIQIESIVTGTFERPESETAYFRVFEQEVAELPAHKLRSSRESTIKIALETDERGMPVVPAQGQHVFAYLPIQRLEGLPFLAHADFVLTASRETVPDLPWNRALRKGIAKCFVEAISSLCAARDPLAYKWMRYCPLSSMQGFWTPLKDDILRALHSSPIIFTRRKKLVLISYARWLPSWFLHEQEALVPDSTENRYISRKYSGADIKTLRNPAIGLEALSNVMMIDRIALELATGRIHRRPLDDAWHDAFVQALETLNLASAMRPRLDVLNIIPLEDGGWVCPESLFRNNVYLPNVIDEDTVQVHIPGGLGLQILHSTACSKGDRLAFYRSLNISACSPELLISRILEKHCLATRRESKDWIADLEILFWYDEKLPPLSESKHSRMLQTGGLSAICEDNVLRRTSVIFFPSDRPCDAQSLLSNTPKDEYDHHGFLDRQVLDTKVANRIRNGWQWTEWLNHFGIAYHPELRTRDTKTTRLNPLMTLIARDNSELFIDSLREHWSDWRLQAISIKTELGLLSVACLDGERHHLQSTFLPTEEVLAESHRFQVEALLPFLKLPSTARCPKLDDWKCLEVLGVSCQVDKSFFLAALRALSTHDQGEIDLTATATAIYSGIGSCSRGQDDASLQALFTSEPLIYTYSQGISHWHKLEFCVWDGLSSLSKFQVLSQIYGNDEKAATFFRTFLDVQDAKCTNYLDELEDMSTSGLMPSRQKLVDIYGRLSDMCWETETKAYIKGEMDNYDLIYGKGRWLRPRDCLWNCTVEISGKEPLDELYPHLRSFFVEHLRVLPMTPTVLVQELVKVAKKSDADPDDARRIMIALGQILGAEAKATVSDESLAILKMSAFLPTRGPDGRTLLSMRDSHSFCINNHKRYGDLFRCELNMLDFDCEDLTSLHPLFQTLELEHRYISSLVHIKTTIKSSRVNEELTKHIRGLAYALSCCAVAHNSAKYLNKTTRMHDLLLESEVHVCETMWTELTAREDDRDITVRSERAVVRIKETSEYLKIYVPSDPKGLYSCYCTELPVELARILGIDDRGASKVVYRIINAQAKDVGAIMRDEDLPEFPWLPNPPRSTTNMPNALRVPGSDTHAMSNVSNGVFDPAEDEMAVVVASSSRDNPADRAVEPLLEPAIYTRAFEAPWQRVAREVQYRKLLDQVIRQGSIVPRASRDAFSLSQMGDALNDTPLVVNNAEFANIFRDFTAEDKAWIGAAGELFVFERLQALRVANFSLENWQSSIRHHVHVHPDYHSLERWRYGELADIMYDGNCHRLVQFLINCSATDQYPCFLQYPISTPVNFHLEVKTTTGPSDTPFFLSRKQYRLMHDTRCDPEQTEIPPALYVILRVYNLTANEIRVKAYINPWHLRDNILDFVADPYKVTPFVR